MEVAKYMNGLYNNQIPDIFLPLIRKISKHIHMPGVMIYRTNSIFQKR